MLRIRRAKEADCRELLELVAKLELMTDMSICEHTVIAEDKGLVGMAHLREVEGKLELTHVGVLPEQRGRGIAKKLVQKLIKGQKKAIYLNTVIPQFFEKLGFARTAEFPKQYLKPDGWCIGCRPELCTAMVKKN